MDTQTTYTERELKEIEHALYYAQNLGHGTVGHNMLLLIDKLARLQGFYLAGGGGLTYIIPFGDGFVDAYVYFGADKELP